MKVYTTGQLAKVLQVAPRTISKWFDAGRLKGFRLPSTGDSNERDRRIPEDSVREFLAANGMPTLEQYLTDQQPLCDAGEQR